MDELEVNIKRWRDAMMGKIRGSMSRSEKLKLLLDIIRPKMFIKSYPIDHWKAREAYYKNIGEYEWIDKKGRAFNVGDKWGNNDTTIFMRTSITIPKIYDGKPVFLLIFPGGDGLLKINGKIVQGIDCFHKEIWLTERAQPGIKYELEIEAAAKHQVDTGPEHRFTISQMAIMDRQVEEFYWDFYAALTTAESEWSSQELREFIYISLVSRSA